MAAIGIVAAVVAQSASAVPAPIADYQFRGNLDSSVPGAPQIADVGPGNAFGTETVAGCSTPVRTFPRDSGLRADLSGVLNPNSQTVVLDFRLSDVPQSGDTYERLIGTSDVTSDSGLYVHDGNLDWYDGSDNEGTGAPIHSNQFVEVALLSSQITSQYTKLAFVNGVQQFPDPVGSDQLGPAPRLFKDNDLGEEDSAGAVFRVRVYPSGVTPADIAQIYNESLLGNPAQCPAATAAITGKPKVKKLSDGSILVDAGIQGSCPDWGVGCHGTASLTVAGAKKSKATVLNSVAFTIDRKLTQEVVFGLRSRGKKLLQKLLRKKGKLKSAATVTITGPNGRPSTLTSTGKIKAKTIR